MNFLPFLYFLKCFLRNPLGFFSANSFLIHCFNHFSLIWGATFNCILSSVCWSCKIWFCNESLKLSIQCCHLFFFCIIFHSVIILHSFLSLSLSFPIKMVSRYLGSSVGRLYLLCQGCFCTKINKKLTVFIHLFFSLNMLQMVYILILEGKNI